MTGREKYAGGYTPDGTFLLIDPDHGTIVKRSQAEAELRRLKEQTALREIERRKAARRAA